MTTKISLIHCGARESIIGEKIIESGYDVQLNVFGNFKNPFLDRLSDSSGGSYCIIDTSKNENNPKIVEKCSNSDFVFIGNEAPIINGLGDELRKKGIPVIGPNKDFALEGNKYKTRLLLEEVYPEANPEFYYINPNKYGWEREAKKAVNELNGKVAIKPIEPKCGKGVIVEGDHFFAEDAYKMAVGIAEAGHFLIEEKISGEEWSGQYTVDSKLHTQAFPACRDFKRAYEGDKGLNTGGMACISDNKMCLPFMKQKDFVEGKKITEKLVKKMSEKNRYEDGFLTGIIYPAFVLDAKGIKVFEINNRFGDPEAMNALSVLENNFVDVCFGMIDGNLPNLGFEKKAVAAIYAVPLTYGGYMKNYTGSKKIKWNEKDFSPQTKVYPGSVELLDNDEMQIMNSRSVAVVSKADTLEEALDIANNDIKNIDGHVRHRTDINMDYVENCIKNMKTLIAK